MIFINTRPANRAESLTKAMQARGLKVIELPLLELEALAISEGEQHYQQVFTSTHHYQAMVVVSPSAARLGLASCPKGFVPNCAVIAVGQATATVLQKAGWDVHCPEESSNEGMMRMPELAKLSQGHHVLIWRGRGGRRLLVSHLQDNGVRVDAIAWYQRQCPQNLKSKFKAIVPKIVHFSSDKNRHTNQSKSIVLISSGEAFTNWRWLIDELQSDVSQYSLTDFRYLTFGQRLSDTLMALDLEYVRIDSLFDEEVWRGVVALKSHQ